MDKEALQSLRLEEMEAVVVFTGTNISIMICLYPGDLGVKPILAKALDDDHEKILLRVGPPRWCQWFPVIPPAEFVIAASDVLVMLDKTADDLCKVRILVYTLRGQSVLGCFFPQA